MALSGNRGLTLAELLITVALLAITAAVVLPGQSFNDSNRLAVAAEKVGNALRFARSEAMRSGQSVLVDAETAPGRLRLSFSTCAPAATPQPVIDRQTRRAFEADISSGPWSSGVVLTPRFVVAATAWPGLVFDPAGAAVQACSVAAKTARGTPEAGSGVDLTYAGRSVTIAIDPANGRIGGF